MSARKRVAIVGGGITGAVAAERLAMQFEVHLFDQGRRGPGGRASHRAVQDGVVLPDDPPIPAGALEFDHGCQFFRADDPRMQQLVDNWMAKGWCAQWNGKFGALGSDVADFFGLPSNSAPVFVGTGGMHTLPRSILAECGATVHRGVRVASMERVAGGEQDGMWTLYGVAGEAAFHDSSEAAAAAAPRRPLTAEPFHAVLLTDISSSFGDWHRASAGVPSSFSAAVRDRVRIPLFSAMVAFDRPLKLPYDGITFGNSPLWFAARSASKGFGPAVQRSTTGSSADGAAAAGCYECWTLISTPRFAVDEIQSTPMQDAVTGAFKPQEDSYLNTTPAPALLKAFMDAVTSLRPDPSPEFPTAVYLQGQRWGSALPAPAGIGGRDGFGRGAEATTEMGVTYDMSTPPLVYERPDPMESGRSAEDYLADAPLGLYYAGDFCSGRAPGFEAAALSGNDAAECLQRTLLQ